MNGKLKRRIGLQKARFRVVSYRVLVKTGKDSHFIGLVWCLTCILIYRGTRLTKKCGNHRFGWGVYLEPDLHDTTAEPMNDGNMDWLGVGPASPNLITLLK